MSFVYELYLGCYKRPNSSSSAIPFLKLSSSAKLTHFSAFDFLLLFEFDLQSNSSGCLISLRLVTDRIFVHEYMRFTFGDIGDEIYVCDIMRLATIPLFSIC